jgi:hypothetical protein
MLFDCLNGVEKDWCEVGKDFGGCLYDLLLVIETDKSQTKERR